MTKQDHIDYWKDLADEDVKTVDSLIASDRYVAALFFLHLATEKLLKALWVKGNIGNTPPFIHDLQKIALVAGLTWDADDFDYLLEITSWNLEARYPKYKQAVYQTATPAFMQAQLQKIQKLHKWLQSNL